MASVHTLNVRRQGITILPTEGCNFACHYCHQPHDPIHMSPEVADSIVRFVERKAKSIDRLDISWFGGEPLTNQKLVLGLSKEFVRICFENEIALSGFMSTNGYLLTPALLSRLVGLGVQRFQVTFDGPKNVHDQFRVSKTGGETFARIWENVCSFRSLAETFEILIRVHVTPNTVSDVELLLGELETAFSSDARFKITVANVSRWGGPNDADIPVFEDPGPVLASLGGLISTTNACPRSSNEYCHAADPTHFVIRPSGMVVKCAHSLELEENRIGYLARDGRFVYEPGKIDFWIRGIVDGDRDALECPRNALGMTSLVQIGTRRLET